MRVVWGVAGAVSAVALVAWLNTTATIGGTVLVRGAAWVASVGLALWLIERVLGRLTADERPPAGLVVLRRAFLVAAAVSGAASLPGRFVVENRLRAVAERIIDEAHRGVRPLGPPPTYECGTRGLESLVECRRHADGSFTVSHARLTTLLGGVAIYRSTTRNWIRYPL